MEFDFNELEYYKRFLEANKILNLTFEAFVFRIINKKTFVFEFVSDHITIKSENWKEFKEKVASFFLNEVAGRI